jgi:hypothetical protein
MAASDERDDVAFETLHARHDLGRVGRVEVEALRTVLEFLLG